MKKILLLAALALSLPAVAKDPTPTNAPAQLPAGVTVAPEQGFVNTAFNVYPHGVSNIGIDFSGKEIVVNTKCTLPAELYWNDFTKPLVTSTYRSVDAQTGITAGVIFKGGNYNKNGVYKIVIPEGMFVYASGVDEEGNSTGTEPTPALTLYYEIYNGYSILPNPGVVPELSEVVITFADADEVIINDIANSIDFYKDNAEGSYAITQEVYDVHGVGKANCVVFRFDSEGAATTFIEKGTFGINIPAGAYSYRIYGPNHETDPEDYVEYTTDALLVKYYIPSIPQPEIWPYTDEPIETFEEFELYMPDNFEKFLNNDKKWCFLYGVNDNGVIDDSFIYVRAKIANWDDCTENSVLLKLYDAETLEQIDTYTPPTSGTYCLRLGQGLFSGNYTSLLAGASPQFITSDPFEYYYDVQLKSNPSAVEAIENIEAADVTVYTLTGIRVAANADASVLNTLTPGLYIVNGKKVIVK